MSVDEDIVKSGGSRASPTPSLQLAERTGSYNNISMMTEVASPAPDGSNVAASRPVPAAAPPPNHTGSTDICAHSEKAEQKAGGNENNINRRNSLHHSKQQQQKLTKRRNTSSVGFKHPTSGKRRRRANSESDSVLPTNFLLGGNIFDPLNLNSLLDEEVNRALNAETPKSSPLPAKSRDPVEILIPRDITDPLNLNSGIAGSSFLVPPFKSGGRRRHRNRHHGGGGGSCGGGGGISASQLDLSESGKGELKTSTSALLPGMLASCSVLDDPKASSAISSVSGDSHECQEVNPTSCKEEAMSVSASHTQTRSTEDSTSFTSGGSSTQHPGRRKRRRNSGKMEPPVTHSTPLAKPGSGDRTYGTGGSRTSQSFHTPRSGPRAGPGGRQQQPYNQQKDQQQQQRKKFQYGNYNKYYGYRNPGASEDPRVSVLRPEWFQGKDVLDLGCNSGHLTLYIARMLRPAHILGLDIDSGLVHAARKNIRHYLSELQTQESRRAVQEEKGTKQEEKNGKESHTGAEKKHNEEESTHKNGKPVKGESSPAEAVNDNVSCRRDEAGTRGQGSKTEKMEQGDCELPPAGHPVGCSFPVSLRISRGLIAAPPLTEMSTVRSRGFPSNVSFIQANYVLENDSLVLTQRPEYDIILCLSVTKWVHLNWGDSGLKRLFQRVYRHLRPGGLFILEPQPWDSYARRKKLTDNTYRNYHSIHLKPDHFTDYLIKEVGFSSYEFIGTPKCSFRGFQRPIYLFHK